MPRLILMGSVLMGIAVVLSLSGCATGHVTQTDVQVAAVDGASDDIGTIALRDAVLAYPGDREVVGYAPGDEAPLMVTIVNSGNQPDELVSVSTPAAGEVVVEGMTSIPGGSVASSLDLASTHGLSSAQRAEDRLLGTRELRIVLTDLTGPIRPGVPIPVTFRFRDAGEVTLPVPIGLPVGEPSKDNHQGGKHTGQG
ncbi:MAG: copper chaperone PCu(A)C [Actinomycetota bacterium]|nr:copper chaperone PCu(A)C [Actinomycetota bacterium]